VKTGHADYIFIALAVGAAVVIRTYIRDRKTAKSLYILLALIAGTLSILFNPIGSFGIGFLACVFWLSQTWVDHCERQREKEIAKQEGDFQRSLPPAIDVTTEAGRAALNEFFNAPMDDAERKAVAARAVLEEPRFVALLERFAKST
jgi:hypothetical protein